jgi:hypothetical protein
MAKRKKRAKPRAGAWAAPACRDRACADRAVGAIAIKDFAECVEDFRSNPDAPVGKGFTCCS